MAEELNDPSGYVIKTESQAMTRSQVAATHRSFQEMNDALLAVERQLLHEDLSAANALEVAQKDRKSVV